MAHPGISLPSGGVSRTVAEPCIHCAAARDEIAELRSALGLSGRLTDQRLIERRFGLTRAQAKLCQALYDAAGRVVPRCTLEKVALTEAGYEGGSNVLSVHICRVRAKLGSTTIDTAEGGYAMTPVGRALVYTALKIREPA